MKFWKLLRNFKRKNNHRYSRSTRDSLIRRNHFRNTYKTLEIINIDRNSNWRKKWSRNFNGIFPITCESSKLIITLPEHVFGGKKRKRGGGKKEGIIKSSAFSWNPLIGKKPLTVEICIFLGYTRCNWKLNKNRFSLRLSAQPFN